ncbi:MAG: glycosyl hydrolase family 28-related protein [Pirellulales bacterium]
MRKLLTAAAAIIVATVLDLSLAAPAFAQTAPGGGDEFVGPLARWKNVKTDYGAVGDGKADDTAAVQRGLDDLRLHKDSCVLFFPAGVYRLTRTVSTQRNAHQDCMGVTVVGEDPATTVLRWDGQPGDTMFRFDAWYSKISRLALDGAGRAGVALNYAPRFSTYNETSDMIFQDAKVGMLMGGGPDGQAENEVLRCRFLRCTDAGLKTVNFNSMDIWVWYSRFEDCGHGLYNGAGNFHAYQNLFLRSRQADIGTANLMVFSFVNNTSVGSQCFLDFATGHRWGAQTSVTGNRVLEPAGQWAMRLGSGGPFLVVDNVIQGRPGQDAPSVQMTWGDQTFVGNTYTSPRAVEQAGRFLRLAEKVVAPEKIDRRLPVLPATPPRAARRVFEVPAAADAAAIQAAIDAAAKLAGQRPVVHLSKGNYPIDRTLVVPAGSDVQLVGDGAAETATVLQWAGPAGGLVLRLAGPSRATVRDLSIHAATGSGIRVEKCDQPGGRVFCDEVNVSGINAGQKSKASLLVNGVEESDVLLRCLQGGGQSEKWVEVIGGPKRAAGQETPGQVSVFNGATGISDAQYAVSQGGRLLVRGVYHEMDADSPQGIRLHEPGELCVDSTRFSYKTSPERPLVAVDDFQGRFSLLACLLLPVNSTHTARVAITGRGEGCHVLCMDSMFWLNEQGVDADKVWQNRSDPPAQAAMLQCNVNSGLAGATTASGGFDHLANRGPADEAFILRMLQPLREARVWYPSQTPEGATDVRLARVICRAGKGSVAVELSRE